jgi:Flp pilus assembly protein TadG
MRFLARLRAFWNDTHGASLVELALLAPTLFLLIMGVVDFGRAVYIGIELQDAAHAGAEYGSLNPTNTTAITAAAKQSAANIPNLVVSTPTWGCECSDGSSYSASCVSPPTCTASSTRGSNIVHRVQVTTSSVYTPFLHWPGLPGAITMSSTASMRGNYP